MGAERSFAGRPRRDAGLGLRVQIECRVAQDSKRRGSDGRGVGFYFRNVTELILFGVRGKNARTLAPGRSQVNMIQTRKREHSRKPDEQYEIIEACSPGPYLELFGRGVRQRWTSWGHQADETYKPTWKTYAHYSQMDILNSRDTIRFSLGNELSIVSLKLKMQDHTVLLSRPARTL